MKTKALILLLAAVAACASVRAQNVFPANGNVGIGTAIPSQKLQITSAAINDGLSLVGAGTMLSMKSFQDGHQFYINLAGDASTRFYESIDGTNFLMDLALKSGNVGIGTASPQSALDVRGNLLTTGYIGCKGGIELGDSSVSGINGAIIDFHGGFNRPAEDFNVRLQNYIDHMLSVVGGGLTVEGNVGIGTTTPSEKLDVVGNIHVSGTDNFITFGGIGRLASGAEMTLQAAVGTPLYLNPFAGGDVIVGSFGGDRTLRVIGKVVATTLELTSDRNTKAGLVALDPRETLRKVAELPISTWSYTNSSSVRHIGPMAQDFRAAFNVGEDDKHISVVDGIGVSLAAIQGLHAELQQAQAELQDKDARIAALEEKLARMESLAARVTSLEKSLADNPRFTTVKHTVASVRPSVSEQ